MERSLKNKKWYENSGNKRCSPVTNLPINKNIRRLHNEKIDSPTMEKFLNLQTLSFILKKDNASMFDG